MVVYRKRTPPSSAPRDEAGSTGESRAREQKNLEVISYLRAQHRHWPITAPLPSEPILSL